MNEQGRARLQQLMVLRESVESLAAPAPWLPAADWADEDSHLALHLDVPGVDPDSLALHEESGRVTVSGERAPAGRLLRGERPTGTFSRTLDFPEPVVPQTGQASLAQGVLTVRFEKLHPIIEVPARAAPEGDAESAE